MDDIYKLQEVFEEKDMKIKEYVFDSLCLRYKYARMMLAVYEVKDGQEFETRMNLARRDCLRFFDILRENLLEDKNDSN